MIAAVTVFCGSSNAVEPKYFTAARELGEKLARRGWRLVYGGGSVGLMGALSRAVLAEGGHVPGVIPKALLDLGVGERGVSELVVTDGLRDRKAIMDERGDAFVALPGGLGTLEEVLEVLTLKQLGYHTKPVVVLDLDGFYDTVRQGAHTMAMSPYMRQLREQMGHHLLLLPGVSGLVFNDAGEILLQRRSDNGRWGIIGGMLDPGEEPADALVREVFEETGVRVEPQRITGVYITPVVTYANGDRAQYVITAFRCRPVSGTPHVHDDESLEVRYFGLDELPELRPDHRLRIRHALTDGPAFFVAPR